MANFCPTCGARLDPGVVYCVHCGSSVAGNADSASNPFATPTFVGDGSAYYDGDAPEVPTGPISAVKICLMQKYCSFKGRASRSEYWYWSLAHYVACLAPFVIGVVALAALAALTGGSEEAVDAVGEGVAIVALIVPLLLFLPNLGVAVRRLHDRDTTGWLVLIACIPYLWTIGGLVLFIFYCLPGTPGPNRFGPAPRRR